MHYPADAERFVQLIRVLYGENADTEANCRRIIPIVNDCYAAGLRGDTGFPLDAADLFSCVAEDLGWPLDAVMENNIANGMVPPMVKLFNDAYDQGRQDAAKGGETDEKS